MIRRSRLLASFSGAACLALALCASPALAAAPAWQPIAVSGPTNVPPVQSEVQRLGVDAEGGTFTLAFNSQTTAPIAFNASAETVESTLDSLSTVGGAGGSISITGGPGGPGATAPYFATFGGSLANTNVSALIPDSSSLTGSTQTASVLTSVQGGPGTATLAIYAQNIGGVASAGTVTLSVTLPNGVTTSATPTGQFVSGPTWTCSPGAGQQSFTCTNEGIAQPGMTLAPVNAPVITGPGVAVGTSTVEVTVSGGGAASPASYSMPLTISFERAEPGIESFVAGAYDANGVTESQAGAHPYSGSTAIFANTYRTIKGNVVPVGEFKNIEVELPPGFLGNPISTPQCPEASLLKAEATGGCPATTIVGSVGVVLSGYGVPDWKVPVYNVEAPYGYPGKFFFNVAGVPIHAVGSLRSYGDYGLTVSSINTAQIATIYGTFFTFWGNPASPTHDAARCQSFTSQYTGICATPHPGSNPETSFLTTGTDCAQEALFPPVTWLQLSTWQDPLRTYTSGADIPPVTGCEDLEFEDNFTFEPSNTKADSTASFKTSLTVPSEGLTGVTCEKVPGNPEPCLTTPELKDMVVQLPKGVVLNASGADGLQACSLGQIGYLGNEFPIPNPIRFNKDAQTCPEASKIGTGELKSALLADPLHGALYLAAQGKGNPFGSLFAIYLVIEDPRHGIFIKLPGEVEPSETDGQMQVRFTNLPQLPFTRLDLNLKGGDRSALASPTTCGTYTTTATGTPWSAPESGPPTVTGQSFEINEGPEGGPCAKTPQERPFNIGWEAGSESTAAGASAPFNFRITRPDGSQEIESLELKTAPGVSASLRGIPYCTEAQIKQAEQSTGTQEQNNPACPAASQVGTLTTGAGSGPKPFYVTGKLYLAGPYKGAPISVVAITPAVAGPFDLGNVVVRNAVFINRATAQVSAKSDPIPQILKGVVLRIKDVRIHLNHNKWAINPTSCEPSSVNLTTKGNSGAVADKSVRFQVGGCNNLSFGPKLKAHLTGPTKRGGLPAFTAEINFPEGQANTKDVQVTLPHSEFLEQAHIDTICTRPQAASQTCPAGAIYGEAEAETPLLDGVLKGPVFLKSSDHKLPDLAIFLKGPDNQPIEVEFQGRIDSVKGQIRNTIEGLPDVPVSRFVLKMKGGKKGLLTNSRNLCASKVTKMTVRMVGQNNGLSEYRPPLNRRCKGSAKSKKAKRSAHRTAKRGAARAAVSSVFRSW